MKIEYLMRLEALRELYLNNIREGKDREGIRRMYQACYQSKVNDYKKKYM